MIIHELYRVRRGRLAGQWRFRIRAANGRILATSHDSYHNREDAMAAIKLIQGGGDAPVVEKP